LPLQPHLDIITKSDLILRDIDLLKKFQDCIAALSLSITDDKIKNDLEPLSSSAEKRMNALKKNSSSKNSDSALHFADFSRNNKLPKNNLSDKIIY
jgi:DNA repair photolyase